MKKTTEEILNGKLHFLCSDIEPLTNRRAIVLVPLNTDIIMDPCYNKLWRGHGIWFDIRTVRKLVEKIGKFRSPQFCQGGLYLHGFEYFSYTVFAFQAIPYRLSL